MSQRTKRATPGRRAHSARLFARLSLTLAAIGFVFSVNLAAQAISGDLVGTIADPSGSGVPNATVTATNTGTNVKTTTSTNGAGEYRIANLPPGDYDLTATASGFASATLKSVGVQLNQTATANLTLQVGQVATSVEVSAAGALIDTTTAQIQNTYSTRQIADLPTATETLGVLNLSLLQAGVASNGGVGVGTGPSVGGQRPRNNNFTIEGVDNNDKAVTGPVVYLPNESVEEFTVLQNQFSAEFGHSSGGQFNTIVKSGTNEYHGTVYDYLQNRNLNAIDQSFKNEGIYTLPRYDQNNLGANVGGPILKNKLFFFGSLEYNPLGQASTAGAPVYAPTSAGYSTLASAPGISQTNLGVMEKYAVAPAVTAGGPPITVGNVTVPTGIIPIAGANYQNGYYGVGSVDYNITDADQLRGRFIFNHSNAINSVDAGLPAFYTPVEARDYLATIAEYHTFNPHLTNELRLAYQRENQSSPVGNQTFPGLSAFPTLLFADVNLQIGPNPAYPQARIDNLYQGIENMSWIHGNHTVKFGTEFRDYISPEQFVQYLRGLYEYSTVANYLLDITPDLVAARSIGGSTYYGNELASYSYIQDTWRARRNLTIDLGLRYEYTTVPIGMQMQKLNALANVPGLLTFNAPSADPHGFGPRVGVAYTPGHSGNTVIRAGFGIATEVMFDNIGLNTAPPQFYSLVQEQGAGLSNFLANGGITAAQGLTSSSPAAARAATASYLPNQLTLPYSINWNIGVQHVFLKDYTVEVRYVGTKGVHQIVQEQLNRISDVTPSNSIPTFLSVPSLATLSSLSLTEGALRTAAIPCSGCTVGLDPIYAAAGFTNTITSYEPLGYSEYNGLSAQLNRRFARGLQYQVAYTWSHLIDNSTAEVASTYLTPRRAQDFRDLASEKASSALDRRQRLTAAIVYDAPWFGQSRNWLMRNLVGNWEIAPIYTYESPEYYTPQSGVDSNLNSDPAADRVIVNPNGVAGTGSAVYGLTANGTVVQPTAPTSQLANIVAYVAKNPNARYIQAGPGAYANGGRNLQPIRPIDNVDISLIKHFHAGSERFRVDLGAQAYNVFNHPQFTAGAIDNVSLTPTNSGSALAFAQVNNVDFNNPTLPFSSNPRTLKVFARFNW
ncbi:MAG TPA: carboxypeptidase regulatory-like domain-containing protein [Bryobacteraceae bacterium]|nr:carboxypeptidase regulatory-like domain-containing protein [Bryobacteraceae bacterium]